jgi:hypothetical protein
MLKQWMAMEHYRLHAVQEWPDTEHKRITVAAIRSTLERLSAQNHSRDAFTCCICASRNVSLRVIESHPPNIAPQTLRPAA